MALRVRTPRWRELKCADLRARVSGDFWTTSSPSVRISSMWHGLDMYGLI